MARIAVRGGPDPQVQTPVGNVVKCLGLPGDQGRVAVDDVGDECPDADRAGLGGQGGQQRPAVEPVFFKAMRIEEMIAHPDAVIAERLYVLPVFNQGWPGQILDGYDAEANWDVSRLLLLSFL